jgi:curved DNA-binding protein CbpA
MKQNMRNFISNKSIFSNSIKSSFFKHKNISFNFSDKLKIRKDYYEILGIPKNATELQIKTAYRNLAKKYHPDVNINSSEIHAPNTQKFREIAEAHAVLSNKTMKIDYDTRLRNFPDSDLSLDKLKENMENNQKERDSTGNVPGAKPLKGTYAEYRAEKLKEWRNKFNVDQNGFFKGGG